VTHAVKAPEVLVTEGYSRASTGNLACFDSDHVKNLTRQMVGLRPRLLDGDSRWLSGVTSLIHVIAVHVF
jgi:hypothetical protein